MSSAQTPIAAMFELQRRSIEFGERLFEQTLTTQRDTMETTMRNGFAMQRAAQEQGVELARRLFHAQADAVQATVNGDEFRSIVDTQFEGYDDDSSAAMDEFEAAFLDALEDLTARQRELFVESVDTALDAHADVERQTVEGVGRTSDAARTAQERGEELAAQTATATEQGMAAAEQGVATAQRGAQSGQQSQPNPLEEIDGLGPTYAERLHEEGVRSIADLAETEAEAIAEIADVAEMQAEEWIETAHSRQ